MSRGLHRTGCSPFSGEGAYQNQINLKCVLLTYVRWSPSEGYCQDFNMLAAIILEEDALSVTRTRRHATSTILTRDKKGHLDSNLIHPGHLTQLRHHSSRRV
ncbi:TBC1 domain family member 30-like [Parasteatoda tepidariorum]|uniref:TBC1 domain family member 30-like n=1 Tax=Parasteatoda tepidariorum TaxID=114398 RepID=UPI0039BD125A